MSSPLCTALGIDKDGLVNCFVAVNELRGSNANFLIASLMIDSLKRGHGICLISLHNTLSHFHHVLTKMSAISLNDLTEKSGRVDTVEIMHELRGYLNCADESHPNICDEQNAFSMQRLFLVIRDKVKKLLSAQPNVSIFIDDVSHFLDLGISIGDVLSFIQYCRTLQTIYSGVSLIVLTHVIPEDVTNIIALNMAHVADTVVNISVLKTGHSNDVSGVMEVKEKKNTMSCQPWKVLSWFHFKLTDRHVKLFAPGTSMLRA